MEIIEVIDPAEKQKVARTVLEALPDWFGIPQAREDYIKNSAGLVFFAAYDKEQPAGFICLKETGKDTAEVYVMGVLQEYHRKGIGTVIDIVFSCLRDPEPVRQSFQHFPCNLVFFGRIDHLDDFHSCLRYL